jgi:hypothetical protein
LIAPRLQRGSVVWAELADPNGFVKVRPAIVISSIEDIAAGKPLWLVAITSRLLTPLPADFVLLPWDAKGNSRTGLRRPCAAACAWRMQVSAADIRQVVGFLVPSVLEAILEKVSNPPPP